MMPSPATQLPYPQPPTLGSGGAGLSQAMQAPLAPLDSADGAQNVGNLIKSHLGTHAKV
jgi:hypothetical protein